MLSPAEVSQFHRDGFLLGQRVLDDATVDRLRNELERVIREQNAPGVPQPVSIYNLSGDESRPVWQIVNIWEASDAFRDLIANPLITRAIAQLTGAKELRVWHDQIQFKPSGVGGVNPWHQDSPYWPILKPQDMVTAWVALDEVDESNGCMSMVPGSHLWGDAIESIHGLIKKSSNFDDIPGDYQGNRIAIKRCPVPKGAVHFHHFLTWHGSHANASPRPRRAIALHYLSERIVLNTPANRHIMGKFVGVKPGEMLTGDHFPLVWKSGSALVVEPLGQAV